MEDKKFYVMSLDEQDAIKIVENRVAEGKTGEFLDGIVSSINESYSKGMMKGYWVGALAAVCSAAASYVLVFKVGDYIEKKRNEKKLAKVLAEAIKEAKDSKEQNEESKES